MDSVMENIGTWATPLLLLPGVALLILSTSMRYGQIHAEFHEMDHDKAGISPQSLKKLVTRARFFRNALVSLYVSFGLFSLASLIGGLASAWMVQIETFVMVLSCLGILGLIFAAGTLVREASLSLDVIRDHADILLKKWS